MLFLYFNLKYCLKTVFARHAYWLVRDEYVPVQNHGCRICIPRSSKIELDPNGNARERINIQIYTDSVTKGHSAKSKNNKIQISFRLEIVYR